MAEAAPAAQASAARPRPGLALAVIMIGVLITAVDTTIVILALPVMRASLHVGFAAVAWVILAYLLVITLLATQVGRVGDMFGRVRMYELGFVVFMLGSALCALSWNELSVVGFRVLQGVGAAFVTANSGAIIADVFPPERRGRAYGYTAVGWTAGAVIGILVGGLLITFLSWRWIFWINVPIGIVAVTLALYALPSREGHGRRRFDILGMLTLGLGLFSVLWAMIRLTTEPFGGKLLGFLVAGAVLFLVFALIESRLDEPMVRLSLFRVPTLSPSFLAAFFQGLANFAVLFLIIMYLQGVRALSPLDSALLLVPGYIVGIFMGPLSGRLSDRLGPVVPATGGIVLEVVALFLYAHLGLDTPLWRVSAISVVNGLGTGGFFPANNSAVMKAAPGPAFGVASGLLRTFSNVGMIFSFSVALLVAARSMPQELAFAIFVGGARLTNVQSTAFLGGIHAALYASIAALVIAAILSASRGAGKARRRVGPPQA